MDHEAGDPVHHPLDLGDIPLAEAGEGASRIGEIEARGAHLRVEAQAPGDAGGLVVEALQLPDRVEDDLVGVADDLVDLVIGIRDRIGMRLAAEALMPEPDSLSEEEVVPSLYSRIRSKTDQVAKHFSASSALAPDASRKCAIFSMLRMSLDLSIR